MTPGHCGRERHAPETPEGTVVCSKNRLNRPKWERYGVLWLGYLAIILALGPLGLGSAEAQSLTKVSIRLDWLVDGSYTGEAVAVDKGFYREQGLDLTLNPGGANANPIQLTVGGSDPCWQRGIDSSHLPRPLE
jgi:ABC-type nitrate/sulfonate/bicarbonate transport system substrate-binding protein